MTRYTGTNLSIGALLLERVPTGTGGRCANEQCTRMGRFRIRMAGHYVEGPGTTQRYSFLCSPCSKEALSIWAEMTGRVVDEDVGGVAA